MIATSSLHESAQRLFASYPLAADTSNGCEVMALAQWDGHETRYFVLSRYRDGATSTYSIGRWPASHTESIEITDDSDVPGVFSGALTQGVPIPRDGSLLGWRHSDTVTALIAVYTQDLPASEEPCWSVMPLVDSSETEWPPFTGKPLIGNWFWDCYRAGSIVSVEGLIAASPGAVFWAETETVFGSGCCVVARDLPSSDGYTLPSGRFVYYKVLRAGTPVPSLHALLAGHKTDLATRF